MNTTSDYFDPDVQQRARHLRRQWQDDKREREAKRAHLAGVLSGIAVVIATVVVGVLAW